MKYALIIIIVFLVLGNWFPIIPFPVKSGWHGAGGEFCGIVYDPKCDKDRLGFFTYTDIRLIKQAHAY